jgi:hypothetical protein
MKRYLVTLYYYGKIDSFGIPQYLEQRVEVESDTHVHAEWKASDMTGIRQYYSSWCEEIKD